jgi:hypothetical protein
MKEFDSKSIASAERLELLAELRLELIELVPPNSLNDSIDLTLSQAKKLDHSRRAASKGLCSEWLSLSSAERKNVLTLLKRDHQDVGKPRSQGIFDSSGNVIGIEFRNMPAGASEVKKLRLQDDGKTLSVEIDEGRQPADVFLKLFNFNSQPHSYTETSITKSK